MTAAEQADLFAHVLGSPGHALGDRLPVLTTLRSSALVVKLFRYSVASAVGVVCGQIALIVASAVLDWPGVASNLFSVSVGAVPNYLINRAWTWNKRGPNHLWGEVVPFWGMTLAGLALSTWFVSIADDRWGTTFAIAVAQLSGFGLLWVLKFMLLDRLLFKTDKQVELSSS